MPGKQTTPEKDIDQIAVGGLEIFEIPGGPDVEPTAAHPAPALKTVKEQEEEDELSEKKKDFRFKTHEEAEEGYKEKQAHVTKVEQENSDLRKKTAEQEEELQKFKESEKAKAEAEIAEKKNAAIEKKLSDYSKERHEKALKAIEDLDPEDPEHSSKVAELWADVGADIRKFEKTVADEPLEDLIEDPEKKEEKAKAKPEEKPTGKKAPKEPSSEEPGLSQAEAWKYVEDKVKAEGRDFNNPVLQRSAMFSPESNDQGVKMTIDDQITWAIESADKFDKAAQAEGIDPKDPVYLYMVHSAPGVDDQGKEISLDDQMKQALEETKKHKAAERSRILQESRMPLSGGGARSLESEKGEPAQGMSFGDHIDKAKESRRL